MQLRLETGKPCNDLNSKTFDVKNHRSWIILSAVFCLMLIVVCVVILCRCQFQRNENEVPKSPSHEENFIYYVTVVDDNGKGWDLGVDSKDQDSLVTRESFERKC